MEHVITHLPIIVDTYPKTVWEVEMDTEPRQAYHPELSTSLLCLALQILFYRSNMFSVKSFEFIRNSSTWWGWLHCEAMCRTPIELVLIDRVAAYNDRNPGQKLYVEGETSITTLCSTDGTHRKIISGVADYVLGYKDHASTLTYVTASWPSTQKNALGSI